MARRKNASREQVSQDISSLIAEKTILEQEVEATREELADNRKVIEEELLKGKSKIDVIKTDLKTLESRRESIRNEIAELNKESAQETETIMSKQDEIAGLVLDIDEKEKLLAKIGTKLEQAEGKLQTAIEVEKRTKEAYQKIDELTQDLVSRKNILFGELKLMQQDLENGRWEVEVLKMAIEEDKAAVKADKEEAKRLLSGAKEEIKKMADNKKELDTEIANAQSIEARNAEALTVISAREAKLDDREKLAKDKEASLSGKEEELLIREGKVRQLIRINGLKEKGIL